MTDGRTSTSSTGSSTSNSISATSRSGAPTPTANAAVDACAHSFRSLSPPFAPLTLAQLVALLRMRHARRRRRRRMIDGRRRLLAVHAPRGVHAVPVGGAVRAVGVSASVDVKTAMASSSASWRGAVARVLPAMVCLTGTLRLLTPPVSATRSVGIRLM